MCVKFRTVQNEGKREVSREVFFYNLDMIIAVGYRVNSVRATQFRIWATSKLKEYEKYNTICINKAGEGVDDFDRVVNKVEKIKKAS